ncbi:MAG: hypothetical protein M5R41_08460 [Bacteroidia bacterium]|nr:hypothetical protein [Bacteroidia bacterium]
MTRWLLLVVLALIALFVYTRERGERRVVEHVPEYETLRFGNGTTVRVREPDASERMPGLRMRKEDSPRVDSIEIRSTAPAGTGVRHLMHFPHPRREGPGRVIIMVHCGEDISEPDAFARELAGFGADVHTLVLSRPEVEPDRIFLRERLSALIKDVKNGNEATQLTAVCGPEFLELSLLLAGWRRMDVAEGDVGMRKVYDGVILRGADASVPELFASFRAPAGSAPLLILADAQAGEKRKHGTESGTAQISRLAAASSRVLQWTKGGATHTEARQSLERELLRSFLLYQDAVALSGGIAEAQERARKLGGTLH